MAERRRLARAASHVLAPVLVLALAPAASARDDAGAPPSPRDDVVTVYAGGTRTLHVLANDTDPDGDDLEICRMGAVDRGLRAGEPGRWAGDYLDFPDLDHPDMVVRAHHDAAGQVLEATYYACDATSLAPATVRVRVLRSTPIAVRGVPGRPRLFIARNTQRFPVDFTWQWFEEDADNATTTRLGAGRRVVFSIPVQRGTWRATSTTRGYSDRGRVTVERL